MDIVEGELAGAQGIVQEVNEDTVTLVPKDLGISSTIDLDASQLRKFLSIGEHVAIVGGKFKNHSGMIVKVTLNTVFVYDGRSEQDMEVFKRDVKLAREAEIGAISKSLKYQIGDAVRLDQQRIAIVIKSDFSPTILDENGNERVIDEESILPGEPPVSKTAHDPKGNPIFQGSLVQIIKGPLTGVSGSVKFISNDAVFITSRDVQKNGGLEVVKSEGVAVIGSAPRLHSGVMLPDAMSQIPAGPGVAAALPGLSTAPETKARGPRDPLVFKEVKIISGPHKGLYGTVKDRNGENLRVFLSSNAKTVTIGIAKIKQIDNAPMPIRYAGQEMIGRKEEKKKRKTERLFFSIASFLLCLFLCWSLYLQEERRKWRVRRRDSRPRWRFWRKNAWLGSDTGLGGSQHSLPYGSADSVYRRQHPSYQCGWSADAEMGSENAGVRGRGADSVLQRQQ